MPPDENVYQCERCGRNVRKGSVHQPVCDGLAHELKVRAVVALERIADLLVLELSSDAPKRTAKKKA